MTDNTEKTKNTTESASDLKPSWQGVLLPITIAVTFCVFASYFIYFGAYLKFPPGGPSSWGDFGDFIGGLMNPVVGIVTIFLLVHTLNSQQYAIKMQQQELTTHREELEKQRLETARSALALDAQFRATQIQSFEQTLFNWLNSYKQSLNDIQVTSSKDPEVKLNSLGAIQDVYSSIITVPKDVQNHFGNRLRDQKKWAALPQKIIEETYKSHVSRIERIHQRRNNTNLTRSVRIIYGLLRWIDSSSALDHAPEQRQLYANIVRAQLSEEELRLLFFYGLTPAGKKLSLYINKLSILDNFLSAKLSATVTTLLLSEDQPYTLSAFGDINPTAFLVFQLRAYTVPNAQPKV